MKKFIDLIDLFVEGKIDFKEFDKDWQKLYIGSSDNGEVYETLSDSEKELLDQIHDKEDMVAREDLEELKQYKFISIDDFIVWLKEFKQKNIQFWK